MSPNFVSTITPAAQSMLSNDLRKAFEDDGAFFTTARDRRYRVRRAIPDEACLAGDASKSPTQAGCGWYVITENGPAPRRRMIQLGDNLTPDDVCDNTAQALFDIARVEITAHENGDE